MTNQRAETPVEEIVEQPETYITCQEAPLQETVEQPETVISYQEAPLEETVEQPATVISYEDVLSQKVLSISLKIKSNFIKVVVIS